MTSTCVWRHWLQCTACNAADELFVMRKPYKKLESNSSKFIMVPTSFISEHSAEYVLVNNIVNTLSHDFSPVVPIYCWATREGATIARQCMAGIDVRLVAAFARRPKIMRPDQEWILMKINCRLFEAAQIGEECGCPVLAGVPLVSNLAKFKLDTPCSWFRVKDVGSEYHDSELELPVNNLTQIQNEEYIAAGCLTKADLTRLIREDTTIVSWDRALEVMKLIKRIGQPGMGAFFMAGYTPFFLVFPIEMR